MFKFLVYFTLTLSALFSIEKLNTTREHLIIPFTEYIAQISAWIIHFFDAQVITQGIIIQSLSNGFAVSIESGCNGVEALIVLASAILVFPSQWRHKLYGISIGFCAVQLLNIIRIISLFYLGQWDQDVFEWAHLYIWEALIMLDVLVVFLFWLKQLPHIEKPVA